MYEFFQLEYDRFLFRKSFIIMSLVVLEAKIRELTNKAKDLRKQSLIPSVCYGKDFASINVQVDYHGFRKLFKKVSTTQVFNLMIDNKETPVLVHEMVFDPVTDRINHIDFLHVNMKEKITTSVPVETEGLSPAVKNFNATITVAKHEIEICCLPMDIPHGIKIDLSKFVNIGDAITVKDLNLGDKVEIIDDPGDVLVTVTEVEEFKEEVAEVPDGVKVEATPTAAENIKVDDGKKEESESKE